MKIPLAALLLNDAGLFQQIVGYHATHRVALVVELNVHVLAEPAAVVIPVGFGVAETLQDGVALDEDILHPANVRESSKLMMLIFSICFVG